MVDFKFPDIGEGIQEGEIVKWLVKDGDTVKENQNIVQVETDKSVVDLPAPSSGIVSNISKKNGEIIKVGEILCSVGESSIKKQSVKETTKNSDASKAKKIEKKPEEKPKKRGLAVVGELEEASEDSEEEYKTQTSTMRGEIQSKNVVASPIVRKLAADNNINLSSLSGSGPDGRILKEDISVYESIGQQKVPVSKETTSYGLVEKIPLKGIRKTISRNMTTSISVPQVTAMEDADITYLWKIKDKEKRRLPDVKITILPFIVKATLAVLKENPYFNSSFDDQNENILLKKYYNLGIAVETPVGLMVPVIKDADRKSIVEIAKSISELAEKSKNRTISIDEMKGSTFTITNYGSVGGTYATPLINPGESAILGLGRIFDRVNPKNPTKISKILPISLTFDHRTIDGAQAARFLETLKTYLEDPNHLFVEL